MWKFVYSFNARQQKKNNYRCTAALNVQHVNEFRTNKKRENTKTANSDNVKL